MKFLGVILDENLSWKDHIETVEHKLAKNVGLLYCAKQFQDETCMVSTHCTKLKAISYKQKQAACITTVS